MRVRAICGEESLRKFARGKVKSPDVIETEFAAKWALMRIEDLEEALSGAHPAHALLATRSPREAALSDLAAGFAATLRRGLKAEVKRLAAKKEMNEVAARAVIELERMYRLGPSAN